VDSGDSLWWWVGLAILSFHRLKLDLSELVLTLALKTWKLGLRSVFPPHLAIQSCCHPLVGLLCWSSPTLGLSFGAMSLNLISALNFARLLIFSICFSPTKSGSIGIDSDLYKIELGFFPKKGTTGI
jgi:hypothetical protein